MSDSERDRRLLEYLWQYRSALRRLIAHWTRPWDDIDEIEAELFHEL
jgi:hypothetical protein